LEIVEEIWDYGSLAKYYVDRKKQKQGEFVVVYPNGKVWEKSYFVDDKRQGERILYNYTHTMCKKQTYENGLKINEIDLKT